MTERALAETDLGWTVAPDHPETIPLLRDLYDEYLPNFRSPWFNANCDEPWDLCKGKSKAREQELRAAAEVLGLFGNSRRRGAIVAAFEILHRKLMGELDGSAAEQAAAALADLLPAPRS